MLGKQLGSFEGKIGKQATLYPKRDRIRRSDVPGTN